ncbi:MAG: hypothetical protein ACKOAH_08425, partial [Pirellula sp.]
PTRQTSNAQERFWCRGIFVLSLMISILLREVSELHQLGLSLAKAKPMANANHEAQNKDTSTPKSFLSVIKSTDEIGSDGEAMRNPRK